MNTPEFEAYHDLMTRRRRSPEEESRLAVWLEQHPEAKTAQREEERLSAALQALPRPEPSPGFAGRVVAAVEREERRSSQPAHPFAWLRRLVPQPAWGIGLAAVLFTSLSLVWVQHNQNTKFQELADSASALTALAALLPDPAAADRHAPDNAVEVLKNFHAVRSLDASPLPDRELLAALGSAPAVAP